MLEVIYFIFNEGYSAHEGEDLVRRDLCFEALRLGCLIASSSIAEPRVHALVAVMAFQAARLPARIDALGDLVLLEDQDRALWDRELIDLAFITSICRWRARRFLSITCRRRSRLSTFRSRPDWPAILELYDQLWEINGSPVVALNRAVAVAKVHGAAEALAAIRASDRNPALREYYLLLAVRGHLLLELERREEARRVIARRSSAAARSRNAGCCGGSWRSA